MTLAESWLVTQLAPTNGWQHQQHGEGARTSSRSGIRGVVCIGGILSRITDLDAVLRTTFISKGFHHAPIPSSPWPGRRDCWRLPCGGARVGCHEGPGSAGFTSNMANVNGVRLHFVSGGAGPALILIHGFPQDWTEYRAIMPRLAKQFTVMALDLRGIGQSSIASVGYDADTLAKDVYELAKAQKLDHIYVVGHDFGGQVAYAFARKYPSVTRGAMLLDSRFPASTAGCLDHDPSVWHRGGARDLPRVSRQRRRQRRRQRAQRHADHHRHGRQIAVRAPHPDDGGRCARRRFQPR